MEQKLVSQKAKNQSIRIREIWDNLDKSSFEKEKDLVIKQQKKGDLYSQVIQIYESKEGRKVNRSTVRRCVNTYINGN